ncbi:MAG TPA: CPBP family intramembrane glutamic endopeptidase [Bacteroidota bacterium]|nr:CPBP family intramembrane glutamic endopeptidase [Bacteroidota bacterium]
MNDASVFPILAQGIALAATGFAIILVSSGRIRKNLAARTFASTASSLVLPLAATAMYCICTLPSGRWHFAECLWIALYFLTPILFSSLKRIRRLGNGRISIALILLIWLPQEFQLFRVDWVSVGGLPWPVGVFVTLIYLLLFLEGEEKLELWSPGNFRAADWAWVAAAYVLLSGLILPLAVHVRFVLPGLNRPLLHKPAFALLQVLGIFFAVAIPEELLFRAWIQKLLTDRMKFAPALAISAVIFGISHLDDTVVTSAGAFGIPNWWYALFATVAGAGYGFIYQRRRSLFASALLHTLVDFTWVMFIAG